MTSFPIPFEDVVAAVGTTPFMSVDQGRLVYDHVRATKPQRVLELGTAHGVGTAYMAAALEPGAKLITVDHSAAAFDPAPEILVDRLGIGDRVEIVRKYSSYNWWLKTEVERADPRFDFVYLDGAKNWTIDGLAVTLIEKILRPGGWLLMDDLGWTYESKSDRGVTDGVTIRDLSAEEVAEPHLRAVFDLIVQQHPSFVELRVQDDWWGWARKRTDADSSSKTLSIETTRTLRAIVTTVLLRSARKARTRLARK